MLLKTVLIPLSAILAVVSALPAGANADAALQADAELEVRDDLPSTPAPGGYEDEGEIINITSSNAPSVSTRSDQVSARWINTEDMKCGTGKSGDPAKFMEWFKAAGSREICMQNGEVKTWVDGKNRFKVANRSGSLRCNKLDTFHTNAWQLSRPGGKCHPKSVWGRDHVFPGQTFSLYSV
ncbi:hypothetical protein V496_01287 [Pseudogymnoascus sp. VKM F-4515 (FW-2607)]|nr:hypothetical protein V496_01287 [Pseudogymnoascus sp. VKM F-4515 (FW-2607)]